MGLLRWFETEGRDLPWRRTRDPWAILVAELMLQQTQVARVVDRWPRFLARFPTVESCAASPTRAVIDEWSGLGYNRRAVNLHRAAQEMQSNHGGVVPAELGDLLALPGIGPYTARAVRVFAFELDDGVVDTNVARILARTEHRTLSAAEAQNEADARVPAGDGWGWNQAMLDLGARHCMKRQPICTGCPLADNCHWYLDGRPLPDPAVGSAGVPGRQSRFPGSDREGRGRLVRRLRSGPVELDDVPAVFTWPQDTERSQRVLAGLVADGLVVVSGATVTLP